MIEILKLGLYDSIQDLGRKGVQQFGVPQSGAMDAYSAKMANLILDNPMDAAVLEFTMLGPTLKCLKDTVICLSGAESRPKINERPVEQHKALSFKSGDVLNIGPCLNGARGYLAVDGGFQTETVLGSRSQYANITAAFKLQKGDRLPIDQNVQEKASNRALLRLPPEHFNTHTLTVFPGPEFSRLSKTQADTLMTQNFSVSKDSNRMAYQLNETLENELQSCITSLVLPGTVQLTPSGQLVILMRDCQTTGGYPRVLQLSEQAIDRLSQKKIGDQFRLKWMGK